MPQLFCLKNRSQVCEGKVDEVHHLLVFWPPVCRRTFESDFGCHHQIRLLLRPGVNVINFIILTKILASKTNTNTDQKQFFSHMMRQYKVLSHFQYDYYTARVEPYRGFWHTCRNKKTFIALITGTYVVSILFLLLWRSNTGTSRPVTRKVFPWARN